MVTSLKTETCRARPAGDESQTHGLLVHINHDDRDGPRRLFGGVNCSGATDNEAVDLELDQLYDQHRNTL